MQWASVLAALGACAPAVLAAPAACQFDSLKHPECWGKFNLETNYYDTGPETGKEVPVTFELKEIDLTAEQAPDGVPRKALAINGQIPGPTI